MIVFYRLLVDFGSNLEPNLGPCWPLFRSKHGAAQPAVGSFCLVYLLFRFFGRAGFLLAPSGLDLGRFVPPFWRFSVPIFFTILSFLHLFLKQSNPMLKHLFHEAFVSLKSGLACSYFSYKFHVPVWKTSGINSTCRTGIRLI